MSSEAPFQAPSSVEDALEQERRLWRKLKKAEELRDLPLSAGTLQTIQAVNKIHAFLRNITRGG